MENQHYKMHLKFLRKLGNIINIVYKLKKHIMQSIPRCSIEDCEKYVVWNCGENCKYCTEHYNEQSREIRESC